jgi:hypothetical protein
MRMARRSPVLRENLLCCNQGLVADGRVGMLHEPDDDGLHPKRLQQRLAAGVEAHILTNVVHRNCQNLRGLTKSEWDGM